MGYINLNKVGDQMTGSINGKPFGLSYSETKFRKLTALQQSAEGAFDMPELQGYITQAENLVKPDWNEVVDHASTNFIKVNPEKGTYHLHLKGATSPVPMPQVLVKKIEDGISMNIDINPIVKAWTRFLRNPNFTLEKAAKWAWYISQEFFNQAQYNKFIEGGLSDEIARIRATTLQVPLTMEGLMQTLKVSTEVKHKFVKDGDEVKQVERYEWEVDEFTGLKIYKEIDHVEDRLFQPAVMGTNGDAFWCENALTWQKTKGHIIRVGHIHTLEDWSMVDCNDNHSCVPGLHVGNFDYVKGYQKTNTLTHNVFVDPYDIGAIVQDNSGAIRCRRYMVWSSFAGVNKNIYHSSRLAELTDAEYSRYVQEAVEKTQKQFADKQKELRALETTIGYGKPQEATFTDRSGNDIRPAGDMPFPPGAQQG